MHYSIKGDRRLKKNQFIHLPWWEVSVNDQALFPKVSLNTPEKVHLWYTPEMENYFVKDITNIIMN